MNPLEPSFKGEADVTVLDDELLTRYLVGDVTAEERRRVESRLEETDLFERLCALEEAMMLAHLRGDLPDTLRDRFAASVLASPARRRHVDRLRELSAALEAAKTDVAPTPQPAPARRRPVVFTPLMWAAAAVVAVAVGTMVARRGASGPGQAGSVPGVESAGQPIVAFELRPGLTRSELRQANVVRRPSAGAIRLHFREAITPLTDLRATLRPVGGTQIDVGSQATIRADGSGITVEWTISARALPPGDYVLTISGASTAGVRETAASRFFSIVE